MTGGRNETVTLRSDYSPNKYFRITQTDDGDICIALQGNKEDEFRIAISWRQKSAVYETF
jgi:hypothetical protein